MIVNDELPMSDLSIYDAVVTQQLLEPDSEIHEPKIMAAPKDDISVVADISTQSEDEAVYANSHEDPRLYQRSLSTFSDTPKDDGVFCGPSSDHCTSELEMVSSFISAILTQDDEEVTTVVLSPDHMAYQDKYCADWDSFIRQCRWTRGILFPEVFSLVSEISFLCFDQPFEEVIYPKGEIEAVSIGKRDVDMLLPDTFVNDTIIDFYINYHWSLIVMCHLGEVATYQDEDVTKLSKVSCVLHMDPIRGNHTGLNGLMKSYLKEEWRGRVPETSEDICSKFDNLRFISLETREIENTSDSRRGLGITWFSLSMNIESRILLFVQLPQ
ncbi:probable ubiquitin-like-specific protease 2B isoform X2 [Tanacetum coccineum]|uniref:Probable ubiquitin-like-specific protease 2B isoform X2 n=1 Tax=Tanacetum coccineum TaxID=301880 RepID=A0ABQ4YMR3_9ASTR